MTPLGTLLRWDATLQARNGFYWATAFIVAAVGGLLLAVPAAARADAAAWVPAIVAINLQITTFFFMAGLMLLERDEGVLAALAVSPPSAGSYLAARITTLTLLGAVETAALVWIGFGARGSWGPMIAGTAALGVMYTALGAVVAARYGSVNALLLPASVLMTVLLLPLLPHLGLGPRAPFLIHPLEPPLTLLRAGYGDVGAFDLFYGAAGSVLWGAFMFRWGRGRVERLMRETGTGEA